MSMVLRLRSCCSCCAKSSLRPASGASAVMMMTMYEDKGQHTKVAMHTLFINTLSLGSGFCVQQGIVGDDYKVAGVCLAEQVGGKVLGGAGVVTHMTRACNTHLAIQKHHSLHASCSGIGNVVWGIDVLHVVHQYVQLVVLPFALIRFVRCLCVPRKALAITKHHVGVGDGDLVELAIHRKLTQH